MLGSMLNFLVVFIITVIPYAHGFGKFVSLSDSCSIVRANNAISLVYDTFTIMLNMVSFKNIGISDSFTLLNLGLLHFFYVFVVGILLINFLIALFSNTVSVMSKHKKIIMKLQRLSVTVILDYRIAFFVKPYIRKRQKQHFMFVKDKVFLVITEWVGNRHGNKNRKGEDNMDDKHDKWIPAYPQSYMFDSGILTGPPPLPYVTEEDL